MQLVRTGARAAPGREMPSSAIAGCSARLGSILTVVLKSDDNVSPSARQRRAAAVPFGGMIPSFTRFRTVNVKFRLPLGSAVEVHNSEGVYGLRRALVLAGAQAQVKSLWKVADEETSQLMVDYYRCQAQLAMLANPARAHPYFWTSFVVTGLWTPLGMRP